MTTRPVQPTPSRTVVQAIGVGVTVAVSGDRAPEVHERLPELWEMCRPLDHTPPLPLARVDVVLDSDPEVVARAARSGSVTGTDLADLLQRVTQAITLAAIDAQAGRCVMLHAACLADPGSGRAVAFVARGGTGKTTLVRTLGPGRSYVTDETTAVLDDNTLLPYPKPLSVRRTPSSHFKDEVAPSTFGLLAPRGGERLAAVLLLDRDDTHAAGPELTVLPTLDAIVELVPHSSHVPDLPRPLGRLADLCESLGGVRRVRYRDAADLAPLVDRLVGAA